MEIVPEETDSSEFLAIVQAVVNGLLLERKPPFIFLIKIDNWFGPRWLEFSGKVLGALGVWRSAPTLPPFVPKRVVSEKKFIAPSYGGAKHDAPLHRKVPSSYAVTRKVAELAPKGILVWYSGASRISGRGSVMAYVPGAQSYWNWYAGWTSREAWRLGTVVGAQKAELEQLIKHGTHQSEIERSVAT